MKKDLNNMMCLDVFLSEAGTEMNDTIEDQIIPSNLNTTPLIGWDIYSQEYFKGLHRANMEVDVKRIRSLAKKYHWKNDLDSIFNVHDFEAIVITDLRQQILWVNEGFTTMTGYSKSFAVNRSPVFLQGEGTSLKTKHNIREQIKKNKPFKDVIVNYKKDSTPYLCEIKVFPLYNTTTTHFMALERKVG